MSPKRPRASVDDILHAMRSSSPSRRSSSPSRRSPTRSSSREVIEISSSSDSYVDVSSSPIDVLDVKYSAQHCTNNQLSGIEREALEGFNLLQQRNLALRVVPEPEPLYKALSLTLPQLMDKQLTGVVRIACLLLASLYTPDHTRLIKALDKDDLPALRELLLESLGVDAAHLVRRAGMMRVKNAIFSVMRYYADLRRCNDEDCLHNRREDVATHDELLALLHTPASMAVRADRFERLKSERMEKALAIVVRHASAHALARLRALPTRRVRSVRVYKADDTYEDVRVR